MATYTSGTAPQVPCLKAAESALAGSLLVYLYAELRLLSATGYAVTSFDDLAVDSDRLLTRMDPTNQGFTTGQMFVALLAELRREAALDAKTAAPFLKPHESTSDSGTKRKHIDDVKSNVKLINEVERMVARDLIKTKELKDNHNHVAGGCLCKHFDLHYLQSALDEFSLAFNLTTEDTKEDQLDATKRDKLLNLLEDAMKNKSSQGLGILASQFEEGSLTRLVLENEGELLWFQDYYVVKELVFGVAINRQTRNVTVIFRGTITPNDWSHNLDASLITLDNPIEEDYEGKAPTIQLHRGFQNYLLRKRLDTNRSWVDRICDLVIDYGDRLLGGDYQVVATGHSLGGALATIFGFYVSVDQRVNQKDPVTIYSFASPMLGDHSFADAFRHQESHGRIRHARIHNGVDVVAHVPFNVKVSKRGSTFCHVGMGIMLRWLPTRVYSPYRYLNWPRRPHFEYASRVGFWASLRKAWRNNSLFNVAPLKIKEYHHLNEYEKRVRYALSLEENEMCKLSLEELYERFCSECQIG